MTSNATPLLPKLLFSLSLAALFTLSGCGSKTEGTLADTQIPTKPSPQPAPMPARAARGSDAMARTPGSFSKNLLTAFTMWTPVLNGDVAFESQGHGGILVRSYLNPIAADRARASAEPYPLPEGAVLAKAVVADSGTPATSASRVYFMRKEAKGFDPANGDWSYALARRTANGLAFDPGVGPKQQACVSCHVKFKRYDNVQTVAFFRAQAIGPAP